MSTKAKSTKNTKAPKAPKKARAAKAKAPKAPRGKASRPVIQLLDLLGRRWALRILWELGEASRSFRDLRTACDNMSPSVLNQRLVELRETGIVDLEEAGGYALSAEGKKLLKGLAGVEAWADRWKS